MNYNEPGKYKHNDEYSKYLICSEPLPLNEEINIKTSIIELLKKYWYIISRNKEK
jgi:hypothetical protein